MTRISVCSHSTHRAARRSRSCGDRASYGRLERLPAKAPSLQREMIVPTCEPAAIADYFLRTNPPAHGSELIRGGRKTIARSSRPNVLREVRSTLMVRAARIIAPQYRTKPRRYPEAEIQISARQKTSSILPTRRWKDNIVSVAGQFDAQRPTGNKSSVKPGTGSIGFSRPASSAFIARRESGA